jgi:hypothetical protein
MKFPLKAYNVDGTLNKKGTIRQKAKLSFTLGGKKFEETLFATGLGKQKIILGLPWLQENNPLIDWKKGTLTWRTELSDEPDQDEHLNHPVNTLDEDEDMILQ